MSSILNADDIKKALDAFAGKAIVWDGSQGLEEVCRLISPDLVGYLGDMNCGWVGLCTDTIFASVWMNWKDKNREWKRSHGFQRCSAPTCFPISATSVILQNTRMCVGSCYVHNAESQPLSLWRRGYQRCESNSLSLQPVRIVAKFIQNWPTIQKWINLRFILLYIVSSFLNIIIFSFHRILKALWLDIVDWNAHRKELEWILPWSFFAHSLILHTFYQITKYFLT